MPPCLSGPVVAVAFAWLMLLLAVSPYAAADQLEDVVNSLVQAHRGQVAVAIKDLKTGRTYFHRENEPMPTASLIKLAVMVEAYRQAEEGKLDLDQTVTLRKEDQTPGSGILSAHFSPGMSFSLRDAVRMMIAWSDNTATNLVLDAIGLESTAATMERLGLPNTKIHAKVFRPETSIFPERSKRFGLGSTTALETITLLEKLYRRELVSEKASTAMLEHLAACQDRTKLARNLPREAAVRHKTGSVGAIRADAGIVDGPRGVFAICVLTAENQFAAGDAEHPADVLCGQIALAAWQHLAARQAPATKRHPEGSLAIGDTGPLVSVLQRTLNARHRPDPLLAVDGDFGPATEAAVKNFQKANGLEETGKVGPETWRALGPIVEGDQPQPSPEQVNAEKLPLAAPDGDDGPPFVTCKAWAIADGKTGQLLWGHQADQPRDMASTTKMMVAYVITQLAEQKPEVLEEVVTISRRADDTPGSTADLWAGERLSVRHMLYALMLPSGNDAAVALAEHFGTRFPPPDSAEEEADPVARFVGQMNRTAAQLGLKETHFENPPGFSAARHKASPRDLLKLAFAARKHELFRQVTGTRQYGCQVTGAAGYVRNLVWKNTNQLLAIEGYDGVKTGTTEAAGACLVSHGRRGEDELLVVVLGATSTDARYVDSRNLYRWAWRQRK